eukprot:TRINITY_DN3557_c0_g1_i1.p1 TRINITY_DN3557_c0_g1~~TRINITY_DN3557_c0_g1_i1.p1  ORF type:complete len:158 (-),score=21.97 TRINITY_DN3557_c0_g1_i1:47-520(-)
MPTGNEKLPLLSLCVVYFFMAVYALYCGLKLKFIIKKRNIRPNPRLQWHLRRMTLLNYSFVVSNFECCVALFLVIFYDRQALSLHVPTQLMEVIALCTSNLICASLLWYFNPNSSRNAKIFQESNEEEQQQRKVIPNNQIQLQVQETPEGVELEDVV